MFSTDTQYLIQVSIARFPGCSRTHPWPNQTIAYTDGIKKGEDNRQTGRYKERQKKGRKDPSVEKVTSGSLLPFSFNLYAFLFVYLFGLFDIGSHVAQASLEIIM